MLRAVGIAGRCFGPTCVLTVGGLLAATASASPPSVSSADDSGRPMCWQPGSCSYKLVRIREPSVSSVDPGLSDALEVLGFESMIILQIVAVYF